MCKLAAAKLLCIVITFRGVAPQEAGGNPGVLPQTSDTNSNPIPDLSVPVAEAEQGGVPRVEVLDDFSANTTSDAPLAPGQLGLGRGFDARAKIISRFASILAMAQSRVTTNFNNKEFEARIQNYACHCFPQDADGNIIGGRGAVVNEVDKLCKQLYDCHTCITGQECVDPDFDRYDFEILPSGNIDCTQEGARRADRNKLACKQAMCECDRDFATKLGTVWKDQDFEENLWFNAKNIQKQKRLGNPMKKYATVCRKKTHLPNNHECCGRALFNPIMTECCMDDIVSIGSC